MSSALVSLSAGELHDLFQRKEASPVEAVREVLAQASRLQAKLNAFCFLDEEKALAAARAAEARWRKGEARGPLDGIPVSVKDNIRVEGMPTLFGSRAVVPGEAYGEDSPASARLREAGAVLFGKTCLPDFAHKIFTDSPLTGVTRNPWNTEHTPGGSSGGASAALAAAIGPLALGTDGGASIRLPAAFTGVFGFKPSFGRVPHYPRGAFAMLSHVGPMARTVRDAALMMNAIARPDPRDWYALQHDGRDYVQGLQDFDLRGVKVAYSETFGVTAVTPSDEIRQALRKARQAFVDRGAIVEDVDPPAVERCAEIHGAMWTSLSAQLAAGLGERRAVLDRTLLRYVEIGESLPLGAFAAAMIARGEMGKQINEFFSRYELLLGPVYPTTAPSIADTMASELGIPFYTAWCNQMGLPAASVPCGFDAAGLPMALHIVGGQFMDAKVLSACFAFEQARGAAPVLAPA